MARLRLVTQAADRIRRRADPGEAGGDYGFGELRVFGEEAVARVDAVGAGLLRDIDQFVDAQIRLRRGAPAQGVSLIGFAHMQRVAIGIGINGDGSETVVAASAGDPDGDLSTVGDEYFAHDS